MSATCATPTIPSAPAVPISSADFARPSPMSQARREDENGYIGPHCPSDVSRIRAKSDIERIEREAQSLGIEADERYLPNEHGQTRYKIVRNAKTGLNGESDIIITPTAAQTRVGSRLVAFEADGSAYWGGKRIDKGMSIQRLRDIHEGNAIHTLQWGREVGKYGTAKAYQSINGRFHQGEGLGNHSNGDNKSLPQGMTIRRLGGYVDDDGRNIVVIHKGAAGRTRTHIEAVAAVLNLGEYIREVTRASRVPWFANTHRPSMANMFTAPRIADPTRLPAGVATAINRGLVYGSADTLWAFPQRESYVKNYENQAWVVGSKRGDEPCAALPVGKFAFDRAEYRDLQASNA